MHLAEIPQLNSASPEQKLALIDELWASIPPAALPTPSAHLTELDKRVADLSDHPEKTLSPETARARIRTVSGL
jgi:putative addiction module component (TIGR02574 family)